jgi:hypothetical protein
MLKFLRVAFRRRERHRRRDDRDQRQPSMHAREPSQTTNVVRSPSP